MKGVNKMNNLEKKYIMIELKLDDEPLNYEAEDLLISEGIDCEDYELYDLIIDNDDYIDEGLIQDLLDDNDSMLYPLDCFKYLSYTNYLEHKKERQEEEVNDNKGVK
jgi:hypothetical protein